MKQLILNAMPEESRDNTVYMCYLPTNPSVTTIYLCKADNNGTVYTFSDTDLTRIMPEYFAKYEPWV